MVCAVSEQDGLRDLGAACRERWPQRVHAAYEAARRTWRLECRADALVDLASWLVAERGVSFAGLVVEEAPAEWVLRYLFYGDRDTGWVEIVARCRKPARAMPSISARVHAADWHEREAEDAFGLAFEGHPRLGDFVLHNDVWHEGVAPMRKTFDGSSPVTHREPDLNWKPRRIVEEAGAFAMPVGPVYSAATAPVYFQLATVGEDV